MPVGIVHAGRLTLAARIGVDVGADEAQFLDAALELHRADLRIDRGALRQLRHADEAVGMELDDARDEIVGHAANRLLEKRPRPVPHRDGPRPDQLNVDLALVHALQVRLLRVFEQLVGDVELSIGCVERYHAAQVAAKVRRRAHVAVDVDDFMVLIHGSSWLMGLPLSYFSRRTFSSGRFSRNGSGQPTYSLNPGRVRMRSLTTLSMPLSGTIGARFHSGAYAATERLTSAAFCSLSHF